ncbi:hypothetical protein Tco_0431211 [Tanacetum coccineum]
MVAPKTEEKHVLSKTVTLQTSPNKKKDVETKQNVIAPGMYKATTQQEPHTKRAKSVLPSTDLSVASSVRRPLNSDSPLNNMTDVLCVSYAKNVLILCHDKCLANYKLNVHLNVRRALFTTPRTAKSVFVDTTPIVSKTRFSVKTTQSMSLDTTPVVSRTKIVAVTPLSNRNKVVQIVLWIFDSGCSKHMTGDRSLLKNFVEKFMGTVRFGNDHFAAITVMCGYRKDSYKKFYNSLGSTPNRCNVV